MADSASRISTRTPLCVAKPEGVSRMSESNGTVAVRDPQAVMEAVITKGDVGRLTAEERWIYYSETCRSIGLNPLTKPFDYLTLQGKTVLYATKSCTDQLRSLRGISVTRVDARTEGDMRVVEVYAADASGRQDMDMGVVTVKGLTGDALANAYMKALTKAKRRVTLSLCGLGMLDESEIETIPGAVIQPSEMDQAETPTPTPARLTGSITPAPSRASTATPKAATKGQAETLDALRETLGLLNTDISKMLGGRFKDATYARAGEVISTSNRYWPTKQLMMSHTTTRPSRSIRTRARSSRSGSARRRRINWRGCRRPSGGLGTPIRLPGWPSHREEGVLTSTVSVS